MWRTNMDMQHDMDICQTSNNTKHNTTYTYIYRHFCHVHTCVRNMLECQGNASVRHAKLLARLKISLSLLYDLLTRLKSSVSGQYWSQTCVSHANLLEFMCLWLCSLWLYKWICFLVYMLQYHEDKARIKDAVKLGKVRCINLLWFLILTYSDVNNVTIIFRSHYHQPGH